MTDKKDNSKKKETQNTPKNIIESENKIDPTNDGNWEKRNITDAHKAKDAVATYKSLGFEVLVKTYNSKADCKSNCDVCLVAAGENCKVIYTRPSQDNDNVSDFLNDEDSTNEAQSDGGDLQ